MVCPYIEQYTALGTTHNTYPTFYFLQDNLNEHHLNFFGKLSAMWPLMHKGYSYIISTTAGCSFIWLSDLEHLSFGWMKSILDGYEFHWTGSGRVKYLEQKRS